MAQPIHSKVTRIGGVLSGANSKGWLISCPTSESHVVFLISRLVLHHDWERNGIQGKKNRHRDTLRADRCPKKSPSIFLKVGIDVINSNLQRSYCDRSIRRWQIISFASLRSGRFWRRHQDHHRCGLQAQIPSCQRWISQLPDLGHRFLFLQWNSVLIVLAGQERFSCISKEYYRGANGCLLVYDITDGNSFAKIDHWYQELLTYCHTTEPPITMLIGNKADLKHVAQVSTPDALAYSKANNLGFFETSAKTNSNVEKAFTTLVEGTIWISNLFYFDVPNCFQFIRNACPVSVTENFRYC